MRNRGTIRLSRPQGHTLESGANDGLSFQTESSGQRGRMAFRGRVCCAHGADGEGPADLRAAGVDRAAAFGQRLAPLWAHRARAVEYDRNTEKPRADPVADQIGAGGKSA